MIFILSTRNALFLGSYKLCGAVHERQFWANCHPFFADVRHVEEEAASKLAELRHGRKSRALFAKPGRYTACIPILDELTNRLDVEGIDALTKAVNESEGRMMLFAHDMRLKFQVAMEIWILQSPRDCHASLRCN